MDEANIEKFEPFARRFRVEKKERGAWNQDFIASRAGEYSVGEGRPAKGYEAREAGLECWYWKNTLSQRLA